jgi:melibiose permease
MSEQQKVSALTKFSYGFGCIGRDMTYTIVNSFIVAYLTFAVGLEDYQLLAVGVIILIGRVWDAVNDPIMGTLIDRTKTRWGKFKPWIIIGAITNCFITVLLFTPMAIDVNWYLVIFGISYLLWDVTYTMNDIGYWSMLPSLSTDPKQREQLGAFARIGANVGLFVVVAVVPMLVTGGNAAQKYQMIAAVIGVIFVLCQILVIVGVKEEKSVITSVDSETPLKEMLNVIIKNDQVLAIAVCILLFNTGYFITTAFGLYFFWFDFRTYGGMEYTIFAIVIGLSQIAALIVYPLLAKKMDRKKIFGLAIIMVIIGYFGFGAVGYVLPMSMLYLGGFGIILFAGQAFIQLLNLVMLADTIEYGQLKLGTRNESIILALNPFVVKVASAIQAGVLAVTLVLTGLNPLAKAISDLEKSNLPKAEVLTKANEIITQVTPAMRLGLRASMLVLPLILIFLSYYVYLKYYKIDGKMYDSIIAQLKAKA